MTTLHVQVSGKRREPSEQYRALEQRFSRARALCAHIQGAGPVPKGITADLFTSGRTFLLLSPYGHVWKRTDQVTCILYAGNMPSQISPQELFWSLSYLEQLHAPVFIIPMGMKDAVGEEVRRRIGEAEHVISSVLQGSARPLHLICHGKTAYAGYSMLLREKNRKSRDLNRLFAGDVRMTALFGGGIDPCLPGREEFREEVRNLPFPISVIALADDPDGTAVDVVKTWPYPQDEGDTSIDFVKPAFSAAEGLFPPCWNTDTNRPYSGETSVLSDTRQQVGICLEAVQMVCLLLAKR